MSRINNTTTNEKEEPTPPLDTLPIQATTFQITIVLYANYENNEWGNVTKSIYR